jgi:molybdopterin-guanine dinucleotide biosynthesis protein
MKSIKQKIAKVAKLLLLSAATSLAVCSCAEEEEFSFLNLSSTKDITLSPAEGNSFIVLSSSHKWTISSADEWCTASHANRNNSAGNDILVALYVTENTGATERRTTLTVTSETGEAARVAVIQKGQNDHFIISSKDSLVFSPQGGDNTMILSASHRWTISSDSGWCEISHANRSNAAGNDILVAFKVGENTELAERRSAVTIASEAGDTVRVAVIQKGQTIRFLTVSKDSLVFSPQKGGNIILLSASHKWTITGNDDWCKVSHANRTNAAGNDILVALRVGENTGQAERRSTITIASEETGETVQIAVIQKGQADRFIFVSRDSLTFSSQGGESTVVLSASHRWTVSSSDAWCKVSHAGGSNAAGNNIPVVFQVGENAELTDRRATVTITLEETGEAVQLPVIQRSKWVNFSPPSADKFIAHAGGAIEGYLSTNSLEAMNLSYSKGCKLFEVDIVETSDSKLFAAHDWRFYKSMVDYPNSIDEPISEAEALSYEIWGKFTPMSEQVIRVWFEEHKDAILVTDKINSPQKIAQAFPSFKNRIIMELFSWDAVEEAIGVGILPMPSGNLIFGPSGIEIEIGIEKKLLDMHIEFIAISRWSIESNKGFLKRLKEQGLKAYVFHVNYDSGKDEKWVLENEMDYCYGLYADNLDLLQP